MSVIVKDIVKKYSSQVAVNGISFEAHRGQIMGFLGPNGAGKSTTMKIITGYIQPNGGEVYISGLKVPSIATKQKIGYLAEHNPLYTDLYVREHLLLTGNLYGLKKSILKSKIDELITLCGLAQEQHKKINYLSKGYRQRVGIAQALIHDPEVLILDEPTSGLDPNQILEIRKLIKLISPDKTIIFSSHILQEVEALCDHVLIIHQGNSVASGKLDDVKKSMTKNTVIYVEFSESIDITLLQSIAQVDHVEKIEGFKYKLLSSDPTIRTSVFKLAAEKNWPLIELKQENSLESIFHELTKK